MNVIITLVIEFSFVLVSYIIKLYVLIIIIVMHLCSRKKAAERHANLRTHACTVPVA